MIEAMPTQLPLIAPDPLAPLPVDAGHYVAALQNRKGELDALQHVSKEAWLRMTPMLEFVGPKTPKATLSRSSVESWVKKVSIALGAHPAYLDILRLDPGISVETKAGLQPVLGHIYSAARSRGMRFLPVVPVGQATEVQVRQVRAAAMCDGHGVGFRYRILRVLPPTGITRRVVLETQLEQLGQVPEECDLLVDLEYLDEDHGVIVERLASQLEQMLAVGSWRSVVLMGTSIPKMMSVIDQGTVGAIPRREWDLWLQLRATGIARIPAFGDYAVQHPYPPHDGGGNNGRANIRYTAGTETLVARGVGPAVQEGPEQYQRLCQQLVERAEFSGRDYSWGDETIQDCAEELIEPGSRNAWRGAGTSHHMQVATDQVRPLAPGSPTGG
jgi:hypothetical protein